MTLEAVQGELATWPTAPQVGPSSAWVAGLGAAPGKENEDRWLVALVGEVTGRRCNKTWPATISSQNSLPAVTRVCHRAKTKKQTRSGKQALLELMARKPGVSKPLRHSASQQNSLTPAQMKAQLTRMMMPQPQQSMAKRRAELTRLAAPSYETASSIGLDG